MGWTTAGEAQHVLLRDLRSRQELLHYEGMGIREETFDLRPRRTPREGAALAHCELTA